MKKQNKYKDRQKKIRDIFSEIANRPEEPEENDTKQAEPQETHEETYEEAEPKDKKREPRLTSTNYFDSTYENPVPVKEVEYQTPPPEIEAPVYQNEYEEELDNLSGPRFVSSRRNRIKAFI